MIVCVCRRLNSAKIDAAIDNGARTPACVMAHHGERFNCGKCRETMGAMIAQKLPANDDREPVLMAAE